MENRETIGLNLSGMALAMSYVPIQQWEAPYDENTALCRGTIFPALDKPFLGTEDEK